MASRVVDLCGVFTFGFSDAANARVGHVVGAGEAGHAARSAWVAVQLSAVVGVVAAIGMVLAPAAIARAVLGDTDETDIAAAAALLPFAAALLLLEGVQSAAGGALSGLRDARGPLLIAVVGGWLVALPLGFSLASVTPVPAVGFWCGLVAGAVLTAALYLRRLRWGLNQLRGGTHTAEPMN